MNFKQWLVESSNPAGNYVAIKSNNLSDFLSTCGIEEPMSGEQPPDGDYHCTLIYSKETSIDPIRVKSALKKFPDKFSAKVKHASCFDSIPKDGSRDAEKSCIVLELDCPELVKIHECLVSIGLKHSYDTYSPHVTLYYNMDVSEAHAIRDKIGASVMNYTVRLDSIYSQTINKDYV